MKQPTDTDKSPVSLSHCPGCGLSMPQVHTAPSDRYQASAECWQLFNELLGYTLSSINQGFVHQLAVDAYGAQHSGGVTKPITTIFSLMGLYLTIEQGYTGWQVQQAHLRVAAQQKNWPRLEPPSLTGTVTVLDVLLADAADAGPERDQQLVDWAASVWAVWAEHHSWVKSIMELYNR